MRIVGRGFDGVAAGGGAIEARGKAVAGGQRGEAGRWCGAVVGEGTG